ncbi:MAG: hypothetical protein ACI9DK_000048 [Vicingaceae bacterium]|jgi:hypothetical protein
MNDNLTANPDRFIGIAIHNKGPMEVSAYNTWQRATAKIAGFPKGSVDRADAAGRESWTSTITRNLSNVTKLGFAIDAKEENEILTLDVYIGYNGVIVENTKLTVVLTEYDVPQSTPNAQSVYQTSGSNNLSPLPKNCQHSHVLRGIITTAISGDSIQLNSQVGYTKVSLTAVDLNSYGILENQGFTLLLLCTLIHLQRIY